MAQGLWRVKFSEFLLPNCRFNLGRIHFWFWSQTRDYSIPLHNEAERAGVSNQTVWKEVVRDTGEKGAYEIGCETCFKRHRE